MVHRFKLTGRQGLTTAIAGLLLLLLGRGLWGRPTLRPSLAPLPQDPDVQVFFNQQQAAVYTDPYRQIPRYGDDLEQVIIDAITRATTSIDVAVHELTLPRIAQALRQQADAGVQVRVILEDDYSQPLRQRNLTAGADDDYQAAKLNDLVALVDLNGDGNLSREELAERDALAILDGAAIPRLDDTADGSKGSGLMHHKFMVVDGRWVLTGSANWTLSGIHGDIGNGDSRGNANGLVVIDSPTLAAHFEEEFALLWGDGPAATADSLFGLQKPPRPPSSTRVGANQVTVQFSPTSSTQPWRTSVNGLISRTLGQASRSVDLALFVFSDQGVANGLRSLHQQGIPIQVLIDPAFAYRSYSEGLDLLGLVIPDHRCRLEARNMPWDPPLTSVGIPTLPPGDKLHHKFAVIDSATVIIGSQNWSQAANETNDENLLVITNPTVAAHFSREFDRLYGEAQTGITPTLQRQLDRRRQQCSGT